jgi:hypothetical protein
VGRVVRRIPEVSEHVEVIGDRGMENVPTHLGPRWHDAIFAGVLGWI